MRAMPWNIQRNRRFSKELIYFDMRENNIRMLLRSARLPLASFKHYKTNIHRKDEDGESNPWCRQCMTGDEESVTHFLLYCNKYNDLRENYMEKLRGILEIHNDDHKDDNSFDPVKITLESIIFPLLNMEMSLYIEFVKATIDFIKFTQS
eukprot:688723_1